MAFGIDDAIAAALALANKFIPDPAAKAAAALEMARMKQAGEFAQLDAELRMSQMQADTNRVEAASVDLFTSRWRPFIGWVCGIGLAVQFLVGPLVTWGAALAGHPLAFPTLDMGTLLTLLLGMLGLGGMRTMEKLRKAA